MHFTTCIVISEVASIGQASTLKGPKIYGVPQPMPKSTFNLSPARNPIYGLSLNKQRFIFKIQVEYLSCEL